MTTTINGRTPEEIKRGLECCMNIECPPDCPYFGNEAVDCNIALNTDAVAAISQLIRERDAAVEDLKSAVASIHFDGDYCELCKHKEPDGQCHHTCITYSSEWGWEWRGVQEVE